jgi:hypothetical protein
MTITTGNYYPIFNFSDSDAKVKLVNLQHFNTKSNVKTKKSSSGNDCDEICDKFLDCLETCSFNYIDEFRCYDLAIKFKKCLNHKKKN